VVEHSLGKGEVLSSILSGSTTLFFHVQQSVSEGRLHMPAARNRRGLRRLSRISGQEHAAMTQNTPQNRSLSGAGEAIERTKNGAAELGEKAGSAFTDIAENARRTLDDKMGSALQFANDTYDSVGDLFRAGEDYVRREPVHAVAVAATLGLAIGYLFAVRSAPQSVARRRSSSRWL
jgi:ElaB/YqjD/DUF883 family membrane-anchored ribosome-binding protein